MIAEPAPVTPAIPPPPSVRYLQAIWDYSPDSISNELPFCAGDVIVFVREVDDAWYVEVLWSFCMVVCNNQVIGGKAVLMMWLDFSLEVM